MNPETILTTQTPIPTPHGGSGHFSLLDEQKIEQAISPREQALKTLKPAISLKLYYNIEEKLAAEKKQLKEILDWQQGKATQLSKYTIILDPHYFEQELLD